MMRRTDKLVSATGGIMSFFSADGEHLAEISVPAGVVDCEQYLELLPSGAHVEIEKGLWLVSPAVRSGVVISPDKFECAANVDYIPATAADLMQRQVLHRLNSLSKANERLEARIRASDAIRLPVGPAKFDDDVNLVEPVKD